MMLYLMIAAHVFFKVQKSNECFLSAETKVKRKSYKVELGRVRGFFKRNPKIIQFVAVSFFNDFGCTLYRSEVVFQLSLCIDVYK